MFKLQTLISTGVTMPDGRIVALLLREGYDMIAASAVNSSKGPLANLFCPYCEIHKQEKMEIFVEVRLVPGETLHHLSVRHMISISTLQVLRSYRGMLGVYHTYSEFSFCEGTGEFRFVKHLSSVLFPCVCCLMSSSFCCLTFYFPFLPCRI
jgi:hypothetical protein